MCLCLRNTKYSDNGSVNETFFFPGQPALNLKNILLPKKKTHSLNCFNHILGDHNVTSLATVGSLRQHPPMSPVNCIETERKMWAILWDSGDLKMVRCHHAGRAVVHRNIAQTLCAESPSSSSVVHPVDDPQIRSASSHPDQRGWTTGFCSCGWIPPCSSSCSTSWLRTSSSAGGCTTADRGTNPAKLRDLCCAPGSCECVCHLLHGEYQNTSARIVRTLGK